LTHLAREKKVKKKNVSHNAQKEKLKNTGKKREEREKILF